MSPGRVAVDRRDGVALLTVCGEHDLSNGEVLRDGLWTVFGDGTAVVVDLSEASFIDSGVLHTLVAAAGPAREASGRMLVVCARADSFTRRVLHMAGLDQVLRIADTVEDALRQATACPVI
jgi:anti-anti-sigma factor